jgi:hypothetical protein
LVSGLSSSEDTNIRITAYWLLARLFLIKKADSLPACNYPFIWNDVVADDMFLRNASSLALKHIGRQSKAEAKAILNRLAVYKDDENLIKREAYTGLAFEFEYYAGD